MRHDYIMPAFSPSSFGPNHAWKSFREEINKASSRFLKKSSAKTSHMEAQASSVDAAEAQKFFAELFFKKATAGAP